MEQNEMLGNPGSTTGEPNDGGGGGTSAFQSKKNKQKQNKNEQKTHFQWVQKNPSSQVQKTQESFQSQNQIQDTVSLSLNQNEIKILKRETQFEKESLITLENQDFSKQNSLQKQQTQTLKISHQKKQKEYEQSYDQKQFNDKNNQPKKYIIKQRFQNKIQESQNDQIDSQTQDSSIQQPNTQRGEERRNRGGKIQQKNQRNNQNYDESYFDGNSQNQGNQNKNKNNQRKQNQQYQQKSYRNQDDEFFQQRNEERKMFDNEQKVFNKNKFQIDEDQVQKSKRTYQGQKLAMLGSASALVGGGSYSQNEKRQGVEKVQIIKNNAPTRNADQASIQYNFRDFISQSQNLTDQCKTFVETLSQGIQECIICSNPIYQRSAIWNCVQCCQPFHLGCIKRWVNKLNNQKKVTGVADEQEANNDREEEKKEEDIDEIADDSNERERRKATKQMCAFYTWTCPNCNYSYAENHLPRYRCYCGRYEEPSYSNMVLPHSCGEYCEQKRHETCTHARCDLLCHPGSCPPCTIKVPVSCFCGKEQQRVQCKNSSKQKFNCDNTCGKLLNCLVHECDKKCHEGPCDPCQIELTYECFCKKEKNVAFCGSKKKRCQNLCGALLDCGKHSCERRCHDGKCEPCPRDPYRLKYCPCGHNTIESLIGRQRKACTDPIPLCKNNCEKFLLCGIHQCKKQCHTDSCELCQVPVKQECKCGKSNRMTSCFLQNYPQEIALQNIDSPELYEEARNFKCDKTCNQWKSCKKHRCKRFCCEIKKGVPDPNGYHLCLLECKKTLQCGLHVCNDFCHFNPCKPCRIYSREPLYCPCRIAKIDPPIQCGQIQPTCEGSCKKVYPCGHNCPLKCHLGNCPPCLEPIKKTCRCGKEEFLNSNCSSIAPNCGQLCGFPMKCGHICQKICHVKGQCFSSIEELMEKGCSQRCKKPRKTCEHRCQADCHPGQQCPEVPCDAEMRHYCKCGYRYIISICKSIENREPLECNASCWKHQRDLKLASAFGSSQQFEESKATFKFEFYPEEVLEFVEKNKKFAEKTESQLQDIVLNKSSKSFNNINGPKRSFVTTLVYEHFKLDMCTFKGTNGSVTDVFWKEGCRVPEILASEVIGLIEKGFMSQSNEEHRNMIFEASIIVPSFPKGSSIDELKKLLYSFTNEYYIEKKSESNLTKTAKIHFYKIMKAKDAFQFLNNNVHQFANIELISHRKEIGTNQGGIGSQGLIVEPAKRLRKERFDVDDDGFTVIKKK